MNNKKNLKVSVFIIGEIYSCVILKPKYEKNIDFIPILKSKKERIKKSLITQYKISHTLH